MSARRLDQADEILDRSIMGHSWGVNPETTSAGPAELPPPGWHPDPAGSAGFRWWDGQSWSAHVSDAVVLPSGETNLISIDGHAFVLARWWRRAAGFVLDAVVIGVPLLLAEMLVSEIAYSKLGAFGFPGDHPSASPAVRVVVNVCGLLLGIAYAVWLIGSRGQTVGMMIVGVRAVGQHDGAGLSMTQAWQRALAVLVLTQLWTEMGFLIGLGHHNATNLDPLQGLFELIGGAGLLLTFMWPLGNSINQTLQDKFANCVVVVDKAAGR
jgi:uncharacterized RDD family membrane protein YckC